MTTISISSIQSSYYCCICLTNYESSSSRLSFTLSCGHQFCKECLVGYIKSRISERTTSFKCFYEKKNEKGKGKRIIENTHQQRSNGNINTSSTTSTTSTTASTTTTSPKPTTTTTTTMTLSNDREELTSRYLICGQTITSSELEVLLFDSPIEFKKLKRFTLEAFDKSIRYCPYCDLQGNGSRESPSITCQGCKRLYCFIHSSSHENITCDEFIKLHADEEKLNAVAVQGEKARACPTCEALIVKAEGCNQLQCPFCKVNYCYLCGAILDSSTMPTHYQWWTMNSCANRQFGDSVANSRLHKFLNILYAILVGIPSTIITAVFFLSCPCICIPATLGFEGTAFHFFMTCTSFVALTLTVMILVTFLIPIIFIGLGFISLFLILTVPIKIYKWYKLRGQTDLRAVPSTASASNTSSNTSEILNSDISENKREGDNVISENTIINTNDVSITVYETVKSGESISVDILS